MNVTTIMKPDNPGNPNPTRVSADGDQGFGQISHEIEIRVRYQETDAQGYVHHSTYINYFEIGRIELLRAAGHSYRELEDQGLVLVVADLGCRYFAPARYDDLLTLQTTVIRSRGARIRHEYELRRGTELVVRGFTVVAAVSPEGKVLRLPRWLQTGR